VLLQKMKWPEVKEELERGTVAGTVSVDEVCRVPLMVRLPGGRGARRSQAFAQPVDFMPTIMELLDVPAPGSMQGKSLVPVFEGKDELRSFALSSPTFSGAHVDVPHPAHRATITTDEWALVIGAQVERATGGETTSMVDSFKQEITILEGPVGPGLYHLPSDPWCTRDVLAEHKDVARRLQADFVSFLREAGMRWDHVPYFVAVPPEMQD
jgi:arylsulfatase A-like enzyme